MYTKNELSGRTRRQYSAEFKQEVVTLCRQPGMSVASVARRHGINHNIVHRWIREHLAPTSNYAPDEMPGHLPGFVPVAVPVKNQDVIEVNLTRGDLQLHIRWPGNAAADAASWLQGLLR